VEWVETTGKTVAEAIEIALDELGVDEQDAEIVIVEESKSGLFGLGRSDARIRARVRPAAPRPKRPQRSRRGRDQGGRDGGRGREGQPAAAKASRSATAPGASSAGSESSVAGVDAGAGNGDAGPPRPTARRRRGGRGRRPAGAGAARAASGEREEEAMSVEQQVELVGSFVRGVVERFGYDATTEVRVEEDHVYVDVTGEDLGLLIGQRGATLDALQELARTVVQRRSEEHAVRVSVDVAGFRAKRAAALEDFVRRSASEVHETGTPEALEPMSASDRKIVHDTVNAIEGVVTTSEGVEPRRYVVIRLDTPATDEAFPED
jgi:spoIIIJ-associated protein